MNSTPTPKPIEPDDALIARADERLAHAYEQIARADEQLARVTEQLAKMERDAEPKPSVEPGPQPAPRKPRLAALAGSMLLALVAAAFILQSSYGRGARQAVTRWVPHLASTPSSPPENASPHAQPAPSPVQVAAADAVPPAAPAPATPLAQTAPQDAAAQTTPATPAAAAASPDQTQLLQTMARELADLGRNVELLRANQQQITTDTSKAIEQLRAGQDEVKRALAKVSEQTPPKTPPPPPTQPTPTVRKLGRMVQAPPVRVRPRVPRIPREWMYDDW
jgi:hypothetical protein